MLRRQPYPGRTLAGQRATAPMRRPGAVGSHSVARHSAHAIHPLTRSDENARLYDYERRVKSAFDAIVPTLKRVSALQHEEEGFEAHAQAITREQLGFELPDEVLANAWVEQLDMKRLFAWCVFKTYRRYCDDFFTTDPLGSDNEQGFQDFLQECGFHTLDISPCADGRLAHVDPLTCRACQIARCAAVYAGAMFDIEDSLDKWVETELLRFREGVTEYGRLRPPAT